MLPNGAIIDTNPKIYRNSLEFVAPYGRDISLRGPDIPWKDGKRPIQLATLPIIQDKPQHALQRLAVAQAAEYPRVAKIIGRGPARNEYGASCVAYARSQGFNVSGNANTWPVAARAAGYIVDHQITIGSILVTAESSAGSSTGHVTGKVERVENGFAYVKEQNYVGGMLTAGWVPLNKVVSAIHLQ